MIVIHHFMPNQRPPIALAAWKRLLKGSVADAFDPTQERDYHGRWGSGAGGASSDWHAELATRLKALGQHLDVLRAKQGLPPQHSASSAVPARIPPPTGAKGRMWMSHVRQFVEQPHVGHVIMQAAEYHAVGVVHHLAIHKLVLPIAQGAIFYAMTRLGLGPMSAFAVESVAMYTIMTAAQKLGLNHETTYKVLSSIAHRLIDADRPDVTGAHSHDGMRQFSAHTPVYGVMVGHHDSDDELPDDIEVLQRYADALDSLTPAQLDRLESGDIETPEDLDDLESGELDEEEEGEE